MASIRMRDGKYQVNIRRRGYPTVTRTFTSRRAAKSWSKTTEIQMERGEFNPHSNITVDELIKRYANKVVPNFSGKSFNSQHPTKTVNLRFYSPISRGSSV